MPRSTVSQRPPARTGAYPPGPPRGRVPRHVPWPMLGSIAAGGVLGALARYGITAAFPGPPSGFPWAIFWINVTGCLIIGVLMVLVTEVWAGHRLLRAFLGVGVLGGFTTFSTYVADIQRLVQRGAAGTALLYLAGTLVAALLAVYAGVSLARIVVTRGVRRAR